MFQNVIIGKPLCNPYCLIARDLDDWFNNEKSQTLMTEERYLPKVMVQAGIVPSTSEVRRNRPDLMITLDKPDCIMVKWGKKRLYIVVGE